MAIGEAVQGHQREVKNEPESDMVEYTDESDDDSDYDSDDDPSFDIVEETQSALSNLSLSKPRSRKCEDIDANLGSELEIEASGSVIPKLDEKDEKSFEKVEELIKGGDLKKLKIDQCKIYLRKYGLRLTGKKGVLISRITEHTEIIDGCGEKKYPPESFVLNCKGDACLGDVVIFEQNVYEMFSIASRSATGPPCGTRTVAGRIVKESYGVAKQQHTFTIEVLWSKGTRPWPPLHPLLIKGRNLYRIKTMRQRWPDEGERLKVLQEKHARGFCARSTRGIRLQEKERRKHGMVTKRKITVDKENHQLQTAEAGSRPKAIMMRKITVDKENHQLQTAEAGSRPKYGQELRPNIAFHQPPPSILGKLPIAAENGASSLQSHKAYEQHGHRAVCTSQAPNSRNFEFINRGNRQHYHQGFQQSRSRNSVYATNNKPYDHRHHYNNGNHYSHYMYHSSASQFVQPLQQPYQGYQKKP